MREAMMNSQARNLPPELLFIVLELLDSPYEVYRCLLVSRLWFQCGIKSLWQKPSLQQIHNVQRILEVLERPDTLSPYAHFVRRLNFTAVSGDLSSHYLVRFAICTNLERITLRNSANLSDDALATMFSSLPRLIAIALPGVRETNDTVLLAIARTCAKLKGLDISGCSLVTDEGVVAVARACAALLRIKLASVDRLTDAAACALALYCPLLCEFDAPNCPNMTDAGVRAIWTRLSDLIDLRVSHGAAHSDAAFSTARTSAIHTGDGDSAETIRLLTRKLHSLRVLELHGCSLLTDEGLDGIVARAPRMRTLGLTKCSALGNGALSSVAKLGDHLQELHLGYLDNITDAGVLLIARSCRRLQYIDLSSCVRLTDASVIALGWQPRLRRVGLVRVPGVTDRAVLALARGLNPQLERVHLSYCANITAPAIHHLLQRLPRLTHLSLTAVPAFLAPGIQRFSSTPPPGIPVAAAAAFCVFSGRGVAGVRAHLLQALGAIGVAPPTPTA